MGYINVGVREPYNVTKKAFVQAIRGNPEKVRIYSTALFGQQFNGTASEIEEGYKLTVVGPEPERKRMWYCTVER